jgi:hypothetical protein
VQVNLLCEPVPRVAVLIGSFFLHASVGQHNVGALAEGFVSVTPLQLDLTAYRALTDLNTWHWDDTSPFETSLLKNSENLSLFHSD